MCSRVTCRSCGKPAWSGCGNHIEQALAGVPSEQRCKCQEAKAASSNGPSKGIFGALFGR